MNAPATPLGLLARAAARCPRALALHAGEVRADYATYAAAVAGLSAALAGAAAAGRTVVMLLRNGIELPVAIFAAQAAGGAATALNPDYTARELAPMLVVADPAVAIVHADLADVLATALPPGSRCRVIGMPADPAGWLAALAAAGGPLPEADPDATGIIQFTGGTTGVPKGVMLTNRALAANVAQREARLPTVWGDERIICTMPLFHSFASAMGLLLAANCAGSLHILPRYRPDWVCDLIEAERITRLPAGPTVFNSLLGFDGLARERLRSLRCAYSGSAPLSMETMARWQARTGVPVYEGYGQSEAGPILTYHGPAHPAVHGSVGPPLAGTEARITDPATGAPAAVGEVEARGPQIMTGYLGDEAATRAAFRDGWLRTGDIGRLDAAGNLFIEDRLKDMAIVGGYNVYPREIDEVMMSCPGIVEAAAVAAPDAYRGEVIHAFFVGAPETALEPWCAERLVKYKRPLAYRALDALPKTAVGKIDKAALRALVAADVA